MNSLKIIVNSKNQNELMEMVRAFEPYIDFSDTAADTFEYNDKITSNNIEIRIKIADLPEIVKDFVLPEDTLQNKKYARRYGKIEIYKALKDYSNKKLPYGCLTGVRPTKLYRELLTDGEDAEAVLKNLFDVSDNKIEHIRTIVENQRSIINKSENEVDVFVNIPFCPTRCAYCSFVAVSIKQLSKYIAEYVKCLKNEISIIKNIVLENNFKVRAVYFGGGTPTSIPVDMLKSLIDDCAVFKPKEFTVEAGRPDTINREVLNMMANSGVTRVSINPQTFHDKTLQLIGRAHTVEDTLKAYRIAKSYDFIINMDLIAALPGESFEDFMYSIDKAVELDPENITVHNLSLKRGSVLTVENYVPTNYSDAVRMIDYSVLALENNDYQPYYMYRQKYNIGNLENSGFAKRGTECIYNVDIMEENCSILAAGSGAIGKRLYLNENRIERLANVKDVKGYIERADLAEERQKNFWK